MTCFVWRKDRDLVSTAAFRHIAGIDASIGHIADRIRPRESSPHLGPADQNAIFLRHRGLSPVGGRIIRSAMGRNAAVDTRSLSLRHTKQVI